MDEHKIRTEYVNRDRQVISDVLKNRFYPMVSSRSKDSYIFDVEDHKCLDMSSGWAVMNAGYGNEQLANVLYESYKRDGFASLVSGMSVESITLAEMLIQMTPGNFEKKVWYGLSGSDANEFIAKMVPQVKKGKKIITFKGSYHGQTMGAYAISGHPSLQGFGGKGTYLDFPNCYRCKFKQEETCNGECYKTFEEQLAAIGIAKSDVGAIEIEAFLCDGGDMPFPAEYMQTLEKFCHENDAYLIVDEVKTGMGRSGKWFCFEHAGITPDVVVVGKALGAGMPISAVIGPKELMDAGIAQHLFTTAGNLPLCALAIENIKLLEENNLLENADERGKQLLDLLKNLQEQTDVIGDIRGVGLSIGIEFVQNKDSKEPDGDFTARLVYRLFELGLVCFSTGEFSNVIEWTPPLTITEEECKDAVKILQQAILDVKSGMVSDEDIAEYILGSC